MDDEDEWHESEDALDTDDVEVDKMRSLLRFILILVRLVDFLFFLPLGFSGTTFGALLAVSVEWGFKQPLALLSPIYMVV